METETECKIGQEGMICVSGPCVFNGYLDAKIESPFLWLRETPNGKKVKYYKTGDLGYIDKEGYLYISGRLKRFVKIAGEMISLPAIEEVVLKKYGNETEIVLAVEAKEYEDGSVKFVVFSIHPLDVSQINTYLREQGISNLVKINEVILLDEIPLL
jgi:long-chain-fatty-acid--[acyl-carrier-protein] ligase